MVERHQRIAAVDGADFDGVADVMGFNADHRHAPIVSWRWDIGGVIVQNEWRIAWQGQGGYGNRPDWNLEGPDTKGYLRSRLKNTTLVSIYEPLVA